MKYPLDQPSFNEFLDQVRSHANMQTVIITKMSELLHSAMINAETDDDPWWKESDELLRDLQELNVFHESRRWNEENFKRQQNPINKSSNLPTVVQPQNVPENSNIVGLPGLQFNESLNLKANKEESSYGDSWDEESLSRYFNERKPKKKKEEPKTLSEMTREEIEAWERSQDNSSDIYKVKARIMNIARDGGASITPVGEILVNSFVHVLKAFYDFADKIEDKNVKIQLINLTRAQEVTPGTIIKASMSGVRMEKTVDKGQKQLPETNQKGE